MEKPKIAVYCSAVAGLPERWQKGAELTGRWIGSHGATLIYGGVDAGLMTIVSRETHAAGGRVVGVVPARRSDWACAYNDVVIPAADLSERKSTMQLMADAFVVLPGGYGTLDEFATSFGYINFTDQPDKRIVLYNPDGLYDPLLEQLRRMIAAGLLRPQAMDVLRVVADPEGIVAELDKIFPDS